MTDWVIITGATSGIGRALVVHFSNLGCKILAVGRNKKELSVTQSLTILPSNITPAVTDLSKKSSVNDIVMALQSGDTVKYLIHCAATCEPFAPLLTATQDQVRAAIAVNVTTPILLTKRLIPFFTSMTRTLFFGSDYVGTTNKNGHHDILGGRPLYAATRAPQSNRFLLQSSLSRMTSIKHNASVFCAS